MSRGKNGAEDANGEQAALRDARIVSEGFLFRACVQIPAVAADAERSAIGPRAQRTSDMAFLKASAAPSDDGRKGSKRFFPLSIRTHLTVIAIILTMGPVIIFGLVQARSVRDR